MSLMEQAVLRTALDLPIPQPRQGKKREVFVSFQRNLNESDRAALAASALGSSTPAVLRLRHSHHAIARYLAEGKKLVEIAAITGYTPGRISVLQSSPAFQELVEYYKIQVEEVFVDFHARLASLGFDSIEELAARLEDDPASFKNRELMELVQMLSDRTGFGPTSKVQHNHAHFSDDAIAAIKAAAASRDRSTVLDLQAAPDSGRSDMGGVKLLPADAEEEAA